MIKGYSGVFRLGEATSTLDADSPVCSFLEYENCQPELLRIVFLLINKFLKNFICRRVENILFLLTLHS